MLLRFTTTNKQTTFLYFGLAPLSFLVDSYEGYSFD